MILFLDATSLVSVSVAIRPGISGLSLGKQYDIVEPIDFQRQSSRLVFLGFDTISVAFRCLRYLMLINGTSEMLNHWTGRYLSVSERNMRLTHVRTHQAVESLKRAKLRAAVFGFVMTAALIASIAVGVFVLLKEELVMESAVFVLVGFVWAIAYSYRVLADALMDGLGQPRTSMPPSSPSLSGDPIDANKNLS